MIDIMDRFRAKCLEEEWTPLIDLKEDGVEISFISPEPEVIWSVKGIDLETAILKVLR